MRAVRSFRRCRPLALLLLGTSSIEFGIPAAVSSLRASIHPTLMLAFGAYVLGTCILWRRLAVARRKSMSGVGGLAT